MAVNWKKIGKMTPAQANEKLTAFAVFMKEDLSKIKKMGAFCLVALALFFFGGRANAYLQSSIQSTIEKRDGYKSVQTFIDTYQRDAENYKTEISKIKGSLIDEDSVEKVSVFVQKTAESNGVTVSSSTRSSSAKKLNNGISGLPMNIQMTGTYSAIIKTLTEIEDASVFINIERATIKPQKTNGASDDVTADLEYLIFFDKKGSDKK